MRYLILFVLVTAGFIVSAQNALSNTKTVVVATYQYADNPRIQNIAPFASYVGETAEVKTVVKSYPTVHALLEAMKKGEADVVFINTFGYLLSREQSDQYEISAALHLPDEAASVYRSVIVSPKENWIASLQDAVDRAGDNYLILVSPGSTSGNLLPRLKLASMLPDDPEKFFVELQYAQRHDAALTLALQEKYAIASCGSDEYYKLGADTTKFNLLWTSEPIQLGPVLVRKQLPENFRIMLKTTLLALHEQNPEALQAIKNGWAEARPADRYVEIDDAYYNSLIGLAGDRAKALRIVKKFAQ